MTWSMVESSLPHALVQMMVVAALGAALLFVFRPRHPRAQGVYCHLVLIVCTLLPLLQPWAHPVIRLRAVAEPNVRMATQAPPAALPRPSAQERSAAATGMPVTKTGWLVRIFLSGIAARLAWLLAGIVRIWRYRVTARPLAPMPEAVRDAIAMSGVGARFSTSPKARGPAAIGWVTPSVMLPEWFSSLDAVHQRAVACHELLHVRRRDGLITLIEEIAGCLHWLNPGAWVLISQARLAREQCVDDEVVRLTGDKESYIAALLSVARSRFSNLAPASAFLRRHHLKQRMHSLLEETSMSRLRVFASYALMVAL